MHRNQNFNKYRQNNLFKQKKETAKTEEEEEENSLLKYLPYIGPLLIFFGVTRLIFYYSNFNINILPFLEFSEIITSIFDLVIALIFLISTFYLSLLFSAFTLRNKSNINKATFYSTIFVLLIIALVGFGQNQLTLEYFGTLSAFLGIIFMLYILLIISKKKASDANGLFQLKNYFFLSIIAIGILIILYDSWNASYEVKKRKKFYGVKVIFNDMQELVSDSTIHYIRDTLVSDSTTYYIGNTNKYIFIYNEKENSTLVRKLDDVKSIVFPKGFNK